MTGVDTIKTQQQLDVYAEETLNLPPKDPDDYKKFRYWVMARWWNGHGYDMIARGLKYKPQITKLVDFLLKSIYPYQISITDKKQQPEIEMEEE